MDAVNNGSYGRSGRGQFAAGNKLASGNPNHKRMFELRKSLLDAIGPERIRAIALKLADLAEGGDTAAAKLLFDYVLGRPPQPIELTGSETRPITMVEVVRPEVREQAARELQVWQKEMVDRLRSLTAPPELGEKAETAGLAVDRPGNND